MRRVVCVARAGIFVFFVAFVVKPFGLSLVISVVFVVKKETGFVKAFDQQHPVKVSKAPFTKYLRDMNASRG